MSDRREGGESAEGSLQGKKREFLESFFKKGAEFTRELLRENDRLRRRAVQVEQELAQDGKPEPSAETLAELVRKLHELEEDKRELLDRVAVVEGAGARFANRYEEIEQENNDLASLFVAQGQLHASLDVSEVVRVIVEILLNFVGAECFALLAPDRDGILRPLAREGVEWDFRSGDPHDAKHVAALEPLRAAAEGAPAWVDAAGPAERRRAGEDPPSVCLPLAVNAVTVAVIAIWAFLPQKEELQELDRRIFDLLCTSGGRALEAALLASKASQGAGASAESLDDDGAGRFEAYRASLD